MQAKPLISVIVPVYNVEPYLRQCIDSIVGQTYPYLEIILINDGSTDASGAICDEYARLEPRIKVIHQANQGLSAARNRGVDLAKGEYLSFVDSDDWLELDMYEELVAVLQTYPDLDLLKFRVIKKARHERYRGSGRLRVYQGTEVIQANRRGTLPAMAWDGIFRREKLGHLRFAEGYYCEDVDYNLRAFSEPDVCVALYDRRYYHYRPARADSIMNSKGNRLLEDLISLWQNLLTEKQRGDTKLYHELQASYISTLISTEGDMLKHLSRCRLSPEDAEYRRAKLQSAWQVLRPQLGEGLMPYLDYSERIYLRYPRAYHFFKHPIRFIKYHKYLLNN